MQTAIEFARNERERHLNELIDFLKIPSVSTLSEHKPDVDNAATWLANQLSQIGLSNVSVMETQGNPVVYGEWMNGRPDAPTVLVYGHYDVQPVDPLELWINDPFEPSIRDGKIYARGSADDKGQMFIHVKAIEALIASHKEVKVNIKLLFEGEEEIGSPNLEPFVLAHKDLLQADMALVSDSDMLGPNQPKIVYGMRGLAPVEFTVRGPSQDLHSGSYGGTVYNPAQLVAEIIASMHDEHGRVLVPNFYDEVRELTEGERQQLNALPYDHTMWQEETGLKQDWGEPEYTIVERIGARPTLEVNGMWGGFQGEGGKTIIPSEAGAKFTARLVPDQDPEVIAQRIADFIAEKIPSDYVANIRVSTGGWWSVTSIESAEIKAASRAYEDVWGVAPVFARGGGSIPILASFQKELGIPSVMMGFGLPEDNIHAPNESFRVEHFHKGIETVLRFYHHLTQEN